MPDGMNAATAANLRRKSAFVDRVQMREGRPLFSLIDINVTELCNRSHGHPRACSFCPRIDPAFYPNQKLHLSLGLARKIGDELRSLDYEGAVLLCGYGEPLLHPQIPQIVACFEGVRLEIVTNGDRLTADLARSLADAGADHFVVSLYDGPEQIDKFHAVFAEAGLGSDHYSLRDRWHSEEEDFGLKLTNRAGATEAGHQAEVDRDRSCFYTAYQMMIDWNGDVLLCPQDWHKRLKFGSLHTTSLLAAWNDAALHKRRRRLIAGDRSGSPCSGCNVDGKLHGGAHAAAWEGSGR